jgi:hypothetical protein
VENLPNYYGHYLVLKRTSVRGLTVAFNLSVMLERGWNIESESNAYHQEYLSTLKRATGEHEGRFPASHEKR